jgi:hypothetical protein
VVISHIQILISAHLAMVDPTMAGVDENDYDFVPAYNVIQRRYLPLKMMSLNDGPSILEEGLVP